VHAPILTSLPLPPSLPPSQGHTAVPHGGTTSCAGEDSVRRHSKRRGTRSLPLITLHSTIASPLRTFLSFFPHSLLFISPSPSNTSIPLPPCQVLVSEYSLGVAPVGVYSDNEALERAYYSRRNAPPGTSSDTLNHMTATPDIASPRDGEFSPPNTARCFKTP
jgi:hypothetical protein